MFKYSYLFQIQISGSSIIIKICY